MNTGSCMPVLAANEMRVTGGTNAERTAHAETCDLASKCGDNGVRQVHQAP